MQIAKIKKLSSGKYKITMNDQSTLTTYDDVILKHNLLFHKKVDSHKLEELNKETKYYEVYNKVVKYIGTKMRSEKEVDNYLQKYPITEVEKKQIKQKLRKAGLLNDELFCKSYTNDRFHLNNCGPEKIKRELEDHNINKEYIEKYINELDEEQIKETLTKQVEKKINQNHSYSSYLLKQKIITELSNQGYQKDQISLIYDALETIDDTIIEKEYHKQWNRLSRKYHSETLIYKLKEKLYQKGFSKEQINQVIEKNKEN